MPSSRERPGCLGWLLQFLGLKKPRRRARQISSVRRTNSVRRPGSPPRRRGNVPHGPISAVRRSVRRSRLPYRLKDQFLTDAELRFYRALKSAVGRQAVICPQVRLADIVYVSRPYEDEWSAFNQISRKHVDFLLCEPRTMQPLCAIELDDASHERADRRKRDKLVNSVFHAAGLPLLRIRVHARYDTASLGRWVQPYLNSTPPGLRYAPPPLHLSRRTPLCPRCGEPMVRRVAKRGAYKGQPFYGCQNYPNCRETLPIAG